MKPYTIEEILLILESARMDDISQRLRELWAEKDKEAWKEGYRHGAWANTPRKLDDVEGVAV